MKDGISVPLKVLSPLFYKPLVMTSDRRWFSTHLFFVFHFPPPTPLTCSTSFSSFFKSVSDRLVKGTDREKVRMQVKLRFMDLRRSSMASTQVSLGELQSFLRFSSVEML